MAAAHRSDGAAARVGEAGAARRLAGRRDGGELTRSTSTPAMTPSTDQHRDATRVWEAGAARRFAGSSPVGRAHGESGSGDKFALCFLDETARTAFYGVISLVTTALAVLDGIVDRLTELRVAAAEGGAFAREAIAGHHELG